MQTSIEQAVCYQVTLDYTYSFIHYGFWLPQVKKDKAELQHFDLCLPFPVWLGFFVFYSFK